jgi:hypothetical protein
MEWARRFYAVVLWFTHMTTVGARRGGFKRLKKRFGLKARGHIVTPTYPGARRLGAGAPITILQFAPLAVAAPVLGFHAIYCVCARFIQQGCVL